MEKKRKTELDIDLDLKIQEDVIEEKPPPPPESEEPEEPEEKGPGFLQKLSDKFNKIPSKIFIIAGVSILIIILVTGAIVYFSQKPEPMPEEPAESVEPEKPEEEAVPSFKMVPQYEFTPFFFPLKEKNKDGAFLKIAFSFDLSNEEVLREIEQNIALLRANVSFALRKKSLSNLKSDPDRTKLGQEILQILNRSLQKGTAVKIYFTQFLIK
ncbi:MAG TPA: flagellar basal body-associated FliL family protein, partial [Nitrospinota bacterium]|jgi:flagellar basal body-associated protein FliL|nr:flagellar basal body-associated FliL family protein [Nitrospinota bacterium]